VSFLVNLNVLKDRIRKLIKYRYANVYDTIYDLGGNTAPVGTLTPTSMPYSYTLLGSANTKASVLANAGATLSI
jgi:pectate lyase